MVWDDGVARKAVSSDGTTLVVHVPGMVGKKGLVGLHPHIQSTRLLHNTRLL